MGAFSPSVGGSAPPPLAPPVTRKIWQNLDCSGESADHKHPENVVGKKYWLLIAGAVSRNKPITQVILSTSLH